MRIFKTFGTLHLDGEGTLMLTKNDAACSMHPSVWGDPIEMSNFHILGCQKRKIWVLWQVVKWVFKK